MKAETDVIQWQIKTNDKKQGMLDFRRSSLSISKFEFKVMESYTYSELVQLTSAEDPSFEVVCLRAEHDGCHIFAENSQRIKEAFE